MPKFLIKIIMPVMEKLTPTCEVVTQKLSESMEHKLPLRERVQIQLHLMGCKFCARYRDQLLVIRTLLEKFDDTMADEQLTEEARIKITQAIKNKQSQ